MQVNLDENGLLQERARHTIINVAINQLGIGPIRSDL